MAIGQIQAPSLTTLDGNEFYVVREIPKGKNKITLILEPMKWVVDRMNLEDELETDESKGGTQYGTIQRTYHTSDIIVLTNNPEMPRWLALCGMNGDKQQWDNPNLFPLIQMKEQLKKKDERISILKSDNANLTEQLRILQRRVTEMVKNLDLMKGKETTILPERFLGTKMEEKKP